MFSILNKKHSTMNSASFYNADGKGFTPHAGRPCLGSLSLDGYWSLTGKLNHGGKMN